MNDFEIAIIGGGHAGVEAALVSARLGIKTVMFSMNLDQIANLPCNPSIGGTAKGHLVREIDALGGQMGKFADSAMLQSRILNKGKGPAVHSLRIQADRRRYQAIVKHAIEKQDNLYIKQAEIVNIILDKSNQVEAVVTKTGLIYKVKAAVICCGTYLNSLIHVGASSYRSGPDGSNTALEFSENLKKLGVEMRRFKTGTPARINKRSINFDKMEIQKGEDLIIPFSFESECGGENLVDCYITYTNEETHRVIMENIHLSAMYSGKIEGTGPRYCPSIEDKIVRFADKPRHQLFVEPMGLDTEEYYLQGMSSSLPEDVQEKFIRTIKGLENAEIMRSAYAIEYDSVDPLQLQPTLEFLNIKGLYGAGQFNGTSGYEEAAAQGLLAGINACLRLRNREALVLTRASSYIGTLIDDIVTKGCSDPYRMMTSRSEYRLLLRQDNADKRLTPIGRELGLISDERWERFTKKYEDVSAEIKRVESAIIQPSEKLNGLLVSRETSPISSAVTVADLIRRPQIKYEDLAAFDSKRKPLPFEVKEQVEISIKYDGYIKKQLAQVEEMRKLEDKKLSPDLDYSQVQGLRIEAAEKLNKIKPLSIGQASRISGVSPADISTLLIWLKRLWNGSEIS